jgi:hypothetical protein
VSSSNGRSTSELALVAAMRRPSLTYVAYLSTKGCQVRVSSGFVEKHACLNLHAKKATLRTYESWDLGGCVELDPKESFTVARSHVIHEGRVRRGNAPLCGARLHTCVEQQQQRLHTGPAGIQSELDQSAVATIRFTEIRRRNPLTRTILEYLHTYLGELAS